MHSAERVGRNETVFREVNERIRELTEQFQVSEPSGLVEFVCECSAESCHAMVSLTLAEYGDVRSDSSHFVTVPGHVWEPQYEREVLRTDRYGVVEKFGAAEDAADAATESA